MDLLNNRIFANILTPFFENIVETGKDFVEDRVEDVKEAAEDVGEFIGDRVEEVKEFAEDAKEFAEERLEDAGEAVSDFVAGIPDAIDAAYAGVKPIQFDGA